MKKRNEIATLVATVVLLLGATESFAGKSYEIPAQERQTSERVIQSRNRLVQLFHNGTLKKCLTDRQIAALILQESRNGEVLVGDGGKALGPLQVWSVYIADVNRAFGTDLTNSDCLRDRELSVLVTLAYMNIYANSKQLKRKPSFEDMARIHNGGPNGHRMKATLGYWKSVSKYYQSLEDWQVQRMVPLLIQRF